jgi:hypothetical protein
MLYAILCYNDEAVVESWSRAQDDAVLAKRRKVQERLAAEGRLGPVARLMPTTAATTIRAVPRPNVGVGDARAAGEDKLVLDGPFAETKEQLLGFYIIDCASLDEAVEAARALKGDEADGAFEIRPLRLFYPGTPQDPMTGAAPGKGAPGRRSAGAA